MRSSLAWLLFVAPLGSLARISPDATCGGKKKYTCLNSDYGDCCSQHGWCGDSPAYCGKGCNPKFGECDDDDKPASSSVIVRSSTRISSTIASSRSSSVLQSSTRSSASPAASKQPVSTNARCGPLFGGRTCQGSQWGNCCSQYSYCGWTDAYCNAETCQKGFGTCKGGASSSSSRVSSTLVTTRSSSAQLSSSIAPTSQSSSAQPSSSIAPTSQSSSAQPSSSAPPNTCNNGFQKRSNALATVSSYKLLTVSSLEQCLVACNAESLCGAVQTGVLTTPTPNMIRCDLYPASVTFTTGSGTYYSKGCGDTVSSSSSVAIVTSTSSAAVSSSSSVAISSSSSVAISSSSSVAISSSSSATIASSTTLSSSAVSTSASPSATPANSCLSGYRVQTHSFTNSYMRNFHSSFQDCMNSCDQDTNCVAFQTAPIDECYLYSAAQNIMTDKLFTGIFYFKGCGGVSSSSSVAVVSSTVSSSSTVASSSVI